MSIQCVQLLSVAMVTIDVILLLVGTTCLLKLHERRHVFPIHGRGPFGLIFGLQALLLINAVAMTAFGYPIVVSCYADVFLLNVQVVSILSLIGVRCCGEV